VKLVVIGQKGVGLALRTAWESSEADFIGYMDLDLATDISHLREVVEVFLGEKPDVVSGSRLLTKSRVHNRTLRRSITSRAFNSLLGVVFKTSVSDGMCGFKFLKRDCLESIVKNGATSDGWFFATQLLLVAEMTGLKLKEIPVIWSDDRNSKVKVIHLSKEYILEILKLRGNIRKSIFKGFTRI
jgi:glycosyltransferase involved in cell wall biosynthesis